MAGVSPGVRVRRHRGAADIVVGPQLIGRVIDPFGLPLDGRPPPACSERTAIDGGAPEPHLRTSIDTPFETGVRVIDGLLTAGRGQRVGLFRGSRRRQDGAHPADRTAVGRRREGDRADRRARLRGGRHGGALRSVQQRARGRDLRSRPARARPGSAGRHRDRRALRPPRRERDARHRFADPLRHGAPRGRSGRGGAARHQGLSPERVRHDAAAAGARRGAAFRRLDHGVLYGPRRGRRISPTRLPTRHGRCSTGTSCCPATSPDGGTSRRSTSSPAHPE